MSADISIANDICSSDRTVVWVRQYPELRPMFMVLKQAISNCRLTSNPAFEPLSAKTCGLASYGLICLIVNYLEHENRRVINQEHYFATLLMGFLRFYGQFDETTKAISMQNGGHYYAIGESDLPVEFDGKPGQLVVVDPDKGTKPDNMHTSLSFDFNHFYVDVNVARSCIKFDQVKLIMNHLAELVEKRMRTADAEESILSSIIKINGHYHEEPRREGSDFISENILIDNGRPVVKARFMDKFNPKKSNHMRGEKRGYNNYEEHNNNNGSNYKGNRTNNATRRHNPYARQPDQYNGSKKRSFNANNQNNRNNSQYNNNDNNRYNSNNSNDRRKRFY